MSTQRHVLRRFESGRVQDFDEQFWPVAVATCILAAFTVGTILTMLRGPWMWGSLLAIPILLGLGLLALSYIEQRFWRRSFQIAMLLSLAFHLAVLIIAYRTEIFGRNIVQVAQSQRPTPIEQLEISVVPTEEIWNQPNPIETPQTEVATERQANTSPAQSQTAREALADDAQSQPNANSQRRESAAQTPQAGQSLSERSRQTEAVSRQSRELAVATSAATNPTPRTQPESNPSPEQVELERQPTQTDPKPVARRELDPESSERAETRNARRREERPAEPAEAAARQARRTAELDPAPTTAPPQPLAARRESAAENTPRELPAADVAATRRESSPTLTRSAEDTAVPSPTDRQPERSEATQIADTMTAAEATERAQRPRQSRAPTESTTVEEQAPTAPTVARTIEPAAESSQIARQRAEDSEFVSHPEPSETLEQTPTEQTARQIQRRADAERPSDLPTAETEPRLARNPSPTPTTTESVEAPTLVASSSQPAKSTLEARPLAMERGTAGTSGGGATPNFGRAAESAASPAQTASDSARREQAESPSEVAQTLSPSQATKISRSTVGLDAPQASLPNGTTVAADNAAGNEPQPLNASAAASVNEALAAGRRSEVSADAGSADVDVGSTKIVSGAARRDSAGGGQPDISSQQPSAARVAARDGMADASIVAATTADSAAAPVTAGSGQPAAPRSEPNAAALVVQRQGGANPRAAGPSRAESAGEPAEFSSATVQNNQTTSRDSRRSNRGAEGSESESDDQPADARRASVARQVVADGPATEGQPRGLAAQSTAPQTSDESESARSDLPRSNRSTNELGASSPARAAADDGLAGTSNLASNSLERQSEQSQSTGGDTVAMASTPARSTQNLQLDVGSGNDGSEFAKGLAADAESNRDEASPRSLEPQRASGSGTASLGPSTQRNTTAATTAARLVDGSGRAESASQGEAVSEAATSKPSRSEAGALDADSTAALAGPANDSAGAAADPNRQSDRVSAARRTENAQARVDIDWDEGAGGLGQQRQPEIGVASRQASPNSDLIAPEPTTRFRRRDASGELAVSPSASVAKAPFANRNPGKLGRSGPQTERAIELGLAFLIRNQKPDGRWSLLGFDDGHPKKSDQLDSDTAATGLALLAFQGAGYTHKEFKYADRLNRAVAWLVSHQRADGNLYVDSDQESNKVCQLYSHAIATLALAEAYGMTQDPNVKATAQKAIDFIVDSQDPKLGGWRYYSTLGQRSSDTSVTGWMVMALHSGRLAGLEVDPKVWEGVEKWLEIAQAPESESQFVYNPNLKDEKGRIRSHLRQAANSTTAIGLLMRMYTGWERNDPRLLDGANILLKQLPSEFNMDVRDTYYWYYATQVLRHVDGPIWQTWNNVLHPLLLSTQVQDGAYAGSWSPFDPVEDKYGRHGGRLYVTALNLLSLEVDYRLLPLYDKTLAK